MFWKRSRFERMIPAYLDGLLSDGDRRRFERQLRADARLQREVTAFRRALDLSLRAKVQYPHPIALQEFLPRLYERIAAEAGTAVHAPEEGEPNHGWGRDALIGGFAGAFAGAVCAALIVASGIVSAKIPKPSALASMSDPAAVVSSENEIASAASPAAWLPSGATTARLETPSASAAAVETSDAAVPDDADSRGYDRLMESQLTPIQLYGDTSVMLISAR